MKRKININKTIIISLILFFLISILAIYSSLLYLPKTMNLLLLKQIMFFIMGGLLIAFMGLLKNIKLIKYSFLIYLFNLVLLGLVLIIGEKTNGIKAWFSLPFIGSIQPSEFMKVGLILFLAKIIDISRKNNEKDIVLIIKVFIVTLIPIILTFLEPDTGACLVYFIIALTMLYIAGIKYHWFIIFIILITCFLSTILYFYFFQGNLFIKIFGSNFFYRLDRLFDWTTSSGMQLKNSIISISSSGIFGHGFNKIPIYFPELQTDFIFASFVSCFGLLGGIILILIIIVFDKEILNIGKYTKENINKYIIFGIIAVIIYQQIQNIAMTIGLLPITGITLPFISYGGSSLLSFMILIGLVLNISNEKRN